MLALLSVWIALGALITSLAVVFVRGVDKEMVITLLPYTVAFSVTLAAAVLWSHRGRKSAEVGIAGRRLQAVASIVMNSLTFAILLIWLHGIVNASIGLLLEGAFLCVVYWLYTRVMVPE